ncbi:MAG: NADH-quinone oxidoreductase subunit J [Acidobacteriota bacterium]|jgi:NADH-quinone oxidoreductase subunit J
MELAIFLIFGALAVGSALVVILHRDPVKSTLSLVVTLFATAVLFLLLGAPFLGVLQVLVYTGAIVVLFLFVVMLLNLPREKRSESGGRMQRVFAVLASLAFVLTGGVAIQRSAAGAGVGALQESFVSLSGFAAELFERFLLPFEIIGLLLLVAVIAAYVLAKRPEAPAEKDSTSTTEAPR